MRELMHRFRRAYQNLCSYLTGQTSIAPLVVLRIVFGAFMLAGTIRFLVKGWVYDLYIKPSFHFSYYGFEWVAPLPGDWMYGVFILMGLSALAIMLGAFYRTAAITFFLTFTYVELLDKTTYLNHYYFVSLISFLLILVPAHRRFSIDILRKPGLFLEQVPRWTITIFMLQMGILYFYAGAAKLNYDWLVRAMPLKTWLTANSHLPVIGWLLDHPWAPYIFSWCGAAYDLSIPFLLLYRKTRALAYAAVVFFHMMTLFLFQIGMFPYIMIGVTLIFFPASFHENILYYLKRILPSLNSRPVKHQAKGPVGSPAILSGILILFFTWQFLMPWRYLLYPGNLFWTEEGYRFSWRVMLMEKSGTAWFYVTDSKTDRKVIVHPDNYLTPFQNKMMATQPDFILEFAHYLEEVYKAKGFKDPKVTTESYVALNGRRSKQFIKPNADLTEKERGFHHKKWIRPYPYETP